MFWTDLLLTRVSVKKSSDCLLARFLRFSNCWMRMNMTRRIMQIAYGGFGRQHPPRSAYIFRSYSDPSDNYHSFKILQTEGAFHDRWQVHASENDFTCLSLLKLRIRKGIFSRADSSCYPSSFEIFKFMLYFWAVFRKTF